MHPERYETREARWARRHPLLTALLIGVLGTILGGLVLFWIQRTGSGDDVLPTGTPAQTAGPNPPLPAFSGVVPTLPPAGGALAAPTGLKLSGDCTNGFVLTWDGVPGAANYRIERDGNFAGTESESAHEFRELPDGRQHRYTVFAQAFPNPRSPASEPLETPACTQ